jgi:hypothetical protein
MFVVIDHDTGLFILKVDVVAAGTLLRVGRMPRELRRVEDLSIGEDIFDPIEDRQVEITEMSCVTLDQETIRDRGFSPKILQGGHNVASLIYGVKVPVLLSRKGYVPPIRGEYPLPEALVFFAFGFERRAIIETPTALCEFVRPNAYAFESAPHRNPAMLKSESNTRQW